MKKIVIATLFSLISTAAVVYGQTDNVARDSAVDSSATNPHRHRTVPSAGAVPVTIIEYKFDGKQLLLPNPSYNQMKPGDFYQVKVDGINGNLYKVLVNTRDTVNSTAIPMPTFTSLDISGISSAIEGINPPSTNIVKTGLAPERLAPGKGKVRVKADTLDNPIGARMLEVKKALNEYLTQLIALKTRLDDWQLDVYSFELNQLKVQPAASAFDYDGAIKAIRKLKSDITDLQSKITELQRNYAVYTSQKTISNQISKDDKLGESDKAITDAFTKLVSGCSDLQSSVTPDKVKDVLTTMINIQNNSNMDYTSLPFQFRNDQAKMVLDIVPRSIDGGLNRYVHEVDFPLMRKAYTGVGISFYGATLHNEAYSTVGVTTGTETDYTVKQEHFAKQEIGVASLFRFGTKFGDSYDQWGGHFTIGPGVSIASTVKPRILTGAGLTFGGKHMFTLDLGFIAGYVDRLSSVVDLNTTLSAKPDNLVVSQLKGGGFVSIGYLYRFQ